MTYNYEGLRAGYYDFDRPGLRKRWHDRKFKTVAREVERANPDVVIDLGCGPGVFLRDHCKGAKLKIGFDISKVQVSYASQFQDEKTYFVSNISKISEIMKRNLPQQQLNITLTSIELIEHISDEDLNEIVAEINNVLKPFSISNIRCVFTTPNRNSSWPLIERFIDFLLGTDYRIQHSNLNSNSELKNRLRTLSIHDPEIFSFLSLSHWLISKLPLKLYSRATWRGMILLARFDMKSLR